MRLHLIALSIVMLVIPFQGLSAQAESAALPTNYVLADCAWDIYLADIPLEKHFAILEKARAKNPDDLSAKAKYATLLVLGKNWGGPEGRQEEGLELTRQAMADGNTTAIFTMGLAKLHGVGVEQNLRESRFLLNRAAQEGHLLAIVHFGGFYLDNSGLGPHAAIAESWFRLAAKRGLPGRLGRLGIAYAKAAEQDPRQTAKAAELLYEAASYGSRQAGDHLREILKQKDAPKELRSAACLMTVLHGSRGIQYLQTSRVKMAARELEAGHGEDPVALFNLGLLYRSGEFGFFDLKRAADLLEKAIALGSDDARCEYAAMQAEGMGRPADPVAALATWRELEQKQHPGAYAYLGYYSYWGSLKHDGLPKDEQAAYGYSRRAAAAGDFFGQHNTALCLSQGIGTARNYLLAIPFSKAAANRGFKSDIKELPRLISAAF